MTAARRRQQRAASSAMTTHRRTQAEFRARGWHHTSLTRCAVRYAALVGCTCWDAGQALGVAAGAVYMAWERIYGTQPPKRVGT